MKVGSHTRWKSRYHYVWGTKYRHNILTIPVSKYLKKLVMEICYCYEYTFDALGTDGDHVHLLLGATPSQRPDQIVRTIKSITARKLFKKHPSLKKILWGGSLWAVGYYWATVGEGQSNEVMREYVSNQGSKEEKTRIKQLRLL